MYTFEEKRLWNAFKQSSECIWCRPRLCEQCGWSDSAVPGITKDLLATLVISRRRVIETKYISFAVALLTQTLQYYPQQLHTKAITACHRSPLPLASSWYVRPFAPSRFNLSEMTSINCLAPICICLWISQHRELNSKVLHHPPSLPAILKSETLDTCGRRCVAGSAMTFLSPPKA